MRYDPLSTFDGPMSDGLILRALPPSLRVSRVGASKVPVFIMGQKSRGGRPADATAVITGGRGRLSISQRQ